MSTRIFCVISLLGLIAGCGQSAAGDLTIERLPDVNPSLPEVPELPPPPYEVEHTDGSFSIYGVRRRGATTMGTDVSVTGYIVEIYEAPVCPEGRTCDPAAAPHLWLADARDPGEDEDRLMLAGYAENANQIAEARELAETGHYVPPDPESGILPIPTDFNVGARVKVQGRFTRVSGSGFNVSTGMLDYRGHEIVEWPPGMEPPESEEEE